MYFQVETKGSRFKAADERLITQAWFRSRVKIAPFDELYFSLAAAPPLRASSSLPSALAAKFAFICLHMSHGSRVFHVVLLFFFTETDFSRYIQ